MATKKILTIVKSNQKQNTFIKRYGMGAIILFLKIQIIYENGGKSDQ